MYGKGKGTGCMAKEKGKAVWQRKGDRLYGKGNGTGCMAKERGQVVWQRKRERLYGKGNMTCCACLSKEKRPYISKERDMLFFICTSRCTAGHKTLTFYMSEKHVHLV